MSFTDLSEHEKQELLEAILDNSYHGILALNAVRDGKGNIVDLEYTFANRTARDCLCSEQFPVLVGKRILEVFPGVEEEGIFEEFVRVIETGEPYNFDRSYNRDGLTGFFQNSVTRFRDGIIISFLETTGVAARSEVLQLLNERYELATSAAGVGVWDLDLVTEELVWDSSMHQIYGIPPEEFGGTLSDWERCVHPEDLDAIQKILQKAIRERTDLYIKYRIIRNGGEIRWIDGRARVKLDDSGNPLRMIGTNWDVTELQTAYNNLAVAKEQAEKANAAKSEFLAVMSHELRTPLNPIIGGAELLKDMVRDEESRSLLEMMEQCSRNLLDLISEVLDFCAIDAGRISLKPVPVDAFDCVRQVCLEFRETARAKGLVLSFSAAEDFPKSCSLDPKRFQQIVRNLVSNALKFTDDGSVAVTLSMDGSTGEGAVLVLQVSDTGPGVPPDRLDFIFERFTQLESANTRREGGTGLGLAICRKLCEQMGGTILVESEFGKGTIFSVRLPVCLVEEKDDACPGSREAALEAEKGNQLGKVLLVDDDESNLSYVRAALKQIGVEVVAEGSPEGGLSRALAEDFDVILLDLHMPGQSGYEVVEAIRGAGGKRSRIPVIAITADVRREVVDDCLACGFDRVLHKPILPDQIRAAMKQVLMAANAPSSSGGA